MEWCKVGVTSTALIMEGGRYGEKWLTLQHCQFVILVDLLELVEPLILLTVLSILFAGSNCLECRNHGVISLERIVV